MHIVKALFVLGLGAFVAGCATAPQVVPEEEQKDPQLLLEERAEAAREAGGFVALRHASSLTLPAAQDRALRRAREELAEVVAARVETLQGAYLERADIADPEPVQEWFTGVEQYLRDLIVGGARPVAEKQLTDDGLSTVWVMVVEDPGSIVQAMEIRGAADRRLFELVRASRAYRELLAEAETFAEYRVSQDWMSD